jgi:beta-lactamase class A
MPVRLVALSLSLLALITQPAFAEAPLRQPPLQERLAAMAADNPGEYGIAALDLSSGRIVSFNGDKRFPMASTVKVAVAATYLSQVDAGQRSLDDKSGGVTAGRLMDLMITRSDNRATDLLLAMIGGPKSVDDWLRSHGLTGIRVDRTIAQLLSDRRDLRDIRDSSTPTAMLGLLRTIDSRNALKPESRRLLLDTMSRCRTGSNRMRRLLPAGTRVEHKTGTLDGYTSDVGFLTMPSGRRIAVALFGRGGVDRAAVLATAARSIYDAFASDVATTSVSSVTALQQTARAQAPEQGRQTAP